MKIIQIVNKEQPNQPAYFDAKLHQNEIKCFNIIRLLVLTIDAISHQTIYQYLGALFQLRCNFASKRTLFLFGKKLNYLNLRQIFNLMVIGTYFVIQFVLVT